VWTEADIDRFRQAATDRNLPHLVDAIELAALTGFRRADLVSATFDEVGEHAIVRTALKKSRGRRRRAAVPLLPETKELLARLRSRERQEGVQTLLVNSLGRPWGSPVSLGDRFHSVRDAAGIMEPGDPSLGTSARPKHLHDLRGTFVTRLCRAQLTDEEIASIVAWSPQNVAEIRRRYVDDAAVVVAIGQRLSTANL
jgi:integrase